MILASHLLVGAAIAVKVNNIAFAIPLAFLSHYILDSFPHQEYLIKNIKERNWSKSFFDFSKIILDFLTGVFLIVFFSNNYFLAFLGGIFAILPDGLIFLQLIIPNKLLKIHFSFHEKFHFLRNKKNPLMTALGVFFQSAFIIISLLFL